MFDRWGGNSGEAAKDARGKERWAEAWTKRMVVLGQNGFITGFY